MAKIYYSIDLTTHGYPVNWIDVHGEKHTEIVIQGCFYPADISQEFKLQHPGAVYMSWDAFCKRLELIADEKARLAAWNQGFAL